MNSQSRVVSRRPNDAEQTNEITICATRLSGREFRGSTAKKLRPKWIAVHYTGVSGASAVAVAKALSRETASAGTHYIADEKTIVECVHEDRVAWHIGDGKPDKRHADGYYQMALQNHERWARAGEETPCNANAVGVDICTVCTSNDQSAASTGWIVTEGAVTNTAMVVAYLMKKYGIDIDHVIRHADATGKLCPRPFVPAKGDDGALRSSTEQLWQTFKDRVSRLSRNTFHKTTTEI